MEQFGKTSICDSTEVAMTYALSSKFIVGPAGSNALV